MSLKPCPSCRSRKNDKKWCRDLCTTKSDPSFYQNTCQNPAVPILTTPVPPQYRPKPPQNPPPEGVGGLLPCRIKGKPQLVLLLLDSFANRNHWNFPFIRQVPFSRPKDKRLAPIFFHQTANHHEICKCYDWDAVWSHRFYCSRCKRRTMS